MSASAGSGVPQRFIHDQRNGADMTPGPVVRAEGQPPVDDPAVNQAYDNFGDTYKFYWEVLHRDSIDDQGMPIHGMVHFDTDYNNAFWDGEGHMWFGDGDGTLFSDFTNSLDVIGHELTHGVTQYTANLAYSGQSGALNESLSDVFGSLVEQYAKQQTVEQADWLIGAEVVGPQLAPALRSMKAPGTANQYDKQPEDMDGFVVTNRDNGGVHTNSGIPNRAFYLTADGPRWLRVGDGGSHLVRRDERCETAAELPVRRVRAGHRPCGHGDRRRGRQRTDEGSDRGMAHGEGALNASVVAVGLVQSGGVAGLDMTATLRLADLPAADADRARGLAEQVLTEPEAPQARTAVYDGLEYELTVTRAGAPDHQIHTRDGALTPAQRALIGELRPHLHPF